MARTEVDKDELWGEIAKVAADAARIKAHRDATWYLWALERVRQAESELYLGLTDAITAWMLANGLDEVEDAESE